MRGVRDYPPLIDYRSSYQYGLLDAVVGLVRSPVGQYEFSMDTVTGKHYWEGYKEGEFLIFENEQE